MDFLRPVIRALEFVNDALNMMAWIGLSAVVLAVFGTAGFLAWMSWADD